MSVETIGADTATSVGTAIPAVGATNTKGGWTQLVASSSFAASALILTYRGTTANGDALIDIGTGAMGAEVVVISNIPCSRQVGDNVNQHYAVFPIAIASGTRISCRFQSTSATQAQNGMGYLIAKDSVGFHDCTAAHSYGQDTTDSGGVSIDPGGSANTKPATFTTITASTNEDNQWITVVIGNQNNSARTDGGWLIDIATGAASSETIILNNLAIAAMASTDGCTQMAIGPFPLAIASGTRISARAQCTLIDATDRLFDIAVILHSGAAAGGGASFYAAIR